MNQHIQVKSAFEVKETQLIDFYTQAFADRIKYIPNCWKWLNRTDFYKEKTPLILEKDGKVIAHAGMIPFIINMGGEKHTASWFIDFKILDQFQRQGLGSILTKEWINYSDCCVTFCNHRSIGVFKKIGWQEDFNTYQLFNFARAFDHPGFKRKLPPFLRNVLNLLIHPFFYLIYKFNATEKQSYSIEKLTDESFYLFYDLYQSKKRISKNLITPVRDKAYAEWRILQSPNKDKYHIYSADNYKALILIHDNHSSYIDILWVSDSTDKEEMKKMIARLGLYALKHKIAYIRIYSSHKELADYVKTKVFSKIRHIRFAFYSKNKDLFDKMKQAQFDFELLDSDFEHIK